MREHSQSDEVVRILYVGQLIKRKGVLQLLDAIDHLRKDHAIVLTVAGYGPLENPLRRAIKARQLASTVELRGYVDHSSLPALYADHDLFVFPTLSDTFGVVLLEAMASGLPVVASCYAGATADFVKPNRNGWIMDPRSAAGISAALEEALAARGSWGQYGAAAREVIAGASPDRAASEILRALELAEGAHAT